MAMTKRDYEALATALGTARDYPEAVNNVIRALAAANPRFNEDTFRRFWMQAAADHDAHRRAEANR